ncbi:rod shape-determining protein [Ruegeria sp. HKCCA5426]|uniref:rod shape-determining protein n=1 Tax=Ruegeria sp. HKCCA5426 TaxID=2682985 RepID=UPI0014879901|nr:rod shape-determining protein [Ruegeria sp. HKCCA5426]
MADRKNEFANENARAMERIVAEAMALARSYPKEFETKLNTRRGAKLLMAARMAEAKDLPFDLLEEPVLEATAAGAGALMDSRPTGRQHYVILDIGAGTTDVAGCICVKVDEDHVKVWEIQNARSAKNLAGNILDNALRKYILDSSSLANGSPEFEQADKALRKTIRTEKENLFRDGELQVDLVTDELVEVNLEDFLNQQSVRKVFDTIKEMVKKAAFAINERGSRVFLVPTGGGANLPIVDDLTAEPLEQDGMRVRLELTNAMPELLQEAYPEIEPFYPQLAVSIGGAHPALPEQKASIDHFEEDPGNKTLAPVYKS